MTLAEEALPRYHSVVLGEEIPYFRFLKKIHCVKKKSLKGMWKEHDEKIKEFREEREKGFNSLRKSGDAEYSLLDLKKEIAEEILKSCAFCERRCGVDRTEGKKGWCKVGNESKVASMFAHHGEESFLVPSGTIFFTGCTMACAYCQNWDISQHPEKGAIAKGEKLAHWIDNKFMEDSVKNANFVGGEPTPNLHTILDTATKLVSNAPLIWNSNMYMSEEAMKLLEGAVDVYLADFRYGNNRCAMRLSDVSKYMETVTGNLIKAGESAEVIMRILVLPNHIDCCTGKILEWVGDNMRDKTYVNLMRQYHPRYKAKQFTDIDRVLRDNEFEKAEIYLKENKIKYFEIQ